MKNLNLTDLLNEHAWDHKFGEPLATIRDTTIAHTNKSLQVESSYIVGEMEAAEEGHDWKYKMGVKFSGTNGASKNLAISKEQFDKIKKILK